ncbi:MAG: alpha/beta hydrolase, partial [Planctomycetota bacterium]
AFCWPSLNFQNHLLQRYRIEEHRIRASEAALAEWIGQLSQLDGQLHVIAHSMGNRGMLESVHRALDGKNVRDGGIGQLIFTAPDVEQGDFVSRAARLAGKSNRMTLYASNKDRALGWSKRLSGFSVRAGLMPPPTILDGLDTILVEHPAPLFSFGHSYYADHQPLLDDIRRLIEHNEQPSTPERSLELDSSRQYWLMR